MPSPDRKTVASPKSTDLAIASPAVRTPRSLRKMTSSEEAALMQSLLHGRSDENACTSEHQDQHEDLSANSDSPTSSPETPSGNSDQLPPVLRGRQHERNRQMIERYSKSPEALALRGAGVEEIMAEDDRRRQAAKANEQRQIAFLTRQLVDAEAHGSPERVQSIREVLRKAVESKSSANDVAVPAPTKDAADKAKEKELAAKEAAAATSMFEKPAAPAPEDIRYPLGKLITIRVLVNGVRPFWYSIPTKATLIHLFEAVFDRDELRDNIFVFAEENLIWKDTPEKVGLKEGDTVVTKAMPFLG